MLMEAFVSLYHGLEKEDTKILSTSLDVSFVLEIYCTCKCTISSCQHQVFPLILSKIKSYRTCLQPLEFLRDLCSNNSYAHNMLCND